MDIDDPEINLMMKAPEPTPGKPDENKLSGQKARRFNQQRKESNLLWVKAIPTMLAIRELAASAASDGSSYVGRYGHIIPLNHGARLRVRSKSHIELLSKLMGD